MVFAGAVEFPTELIIAVLIGFLLVAAVVVSTGGFLAWSISGHRRSAFWLGSAAFLVVVVLLARSIALEWSVAAGYAASAVAGVLHRRLARRRTPGASSLSP